MHSRCSELMVQLHHKQSDSKPSSTRLLEDGTMDLSICRAGVDGLGDWRPEEKGFLGSSDHPHCSTCDILPRTCVCVMVVVWGCGGAKGWGTKGRGLGVGMAMHLLQLPDWPALTHRHRLDQAAWGFALGPSPPLAQQGHT